jgi:hypothetical protein
MAHVMILLAPPSSIGSKLMRFTTQSTGSSLVISISTDRLITAIGWGAIWQTLYFSMKLLGI